MSLKSPLLVVATVLVLAAATCFLATREVSLGQATFAGPLNISGGGSAAAPALILAGDGDTGLYRSGANTLAVAAGGSQQLSLSSSGATFPNGLTVSGGSLTVSGATVDVPAGGVAWAAVDKSGSAIADLATRSAAELDSGTLPDARLSGNVPLVGAKLHTVCASGCDYTNPADAYAAAASGDTLWIAPGTYTATGAWTVNKSVTIDAYGVTFAPAAYSGEFAFHVSSAVALRIFGLTVVGTGDALGRATTVVQVDHAGAVVTLRDVDFTGGADGGGGAGWGIYLDSGTVEIVDSTITGGESGASGSYGAAGILVYDGTLTLWGRTTVTGGGIIPGGYPAEAGLIVGYDGLGSGSAAVYGPGVTVQGGNPGGTAYTSTGLMVGNSGATANIRGARVVGRSGSGDASAVSVAAGTTFRAVSATLIGAGAPGGAVTCDPGTTVSVAKSVTNITPITEASDCTNNITSPDNLEDADVE